MHVLLKPAVILSLFLITTVPGYAEGLSASQAEAEIKRLLDRNLTAGKLTRQPRSDHCFRDNGKYCSILRSDSDQPSGKDIPEGAVLGLSFAIEQDLGCGCCYQDVTTDVGDDDMKLVAALDQLQSLSLMGTQVTRNGLRYLRGLKNLRKLDLCALNITNDDLDVVAQIESLEELDLSGTKVTDHGLRKLAALKHLQKVYFLNTEATGEGLDAFGEHACLEHAMGGPTTYKALVAYMNVKSLKKLETWLPSISLPNHLDVVQISEMPNLESLTFRCQTSFPISVHSLPVLKRLNIGKVKLVKLHDVPTLTDVILSGEISESAVRQVGQLPQVDSLYLAFHNGSNLSGLSELGGLGALTHLSITAYEDEIDATEHLRLPRNLQSFSISAKRANLSRLSEMLYDCPKIERLTISGVQAMAGDRLKLTHRSKLSYLSLDKVSVETVELSDLRKLTRFDCYKVRIDHLTLSGTSELPIGSLTHLLRKENKIPEVRIDSGRDGPWVLKKGSTPSK